MQGLARLVMVLGISLLASRFAQADDREMLRNSTWDSTYKVDGVDDAVGLKRAYIHFNGDRGTIQVLDADDDLFYEGPLTEVEVNKEGEGYVILGKWDAGGGTWSFRLQIEGDGLSTFHGTFDTVGGGPKGTWWGTRKPVPLLTAGPPPALPTKAAGGASHLADHGLSGKIVLFAVNGRNNAGAGRGDIYAMNPDGTGIELVLEGEKAKGMCGRISPDGHRLVMSGWREDQSRFESWILEADGRLRELPEGGEFRAWSPDSTEVVCVRPKGDPHTEEPTWEGRIVNVESGQARPVELPAGDIVEDWSPDGTTFSVMARNPGHVFEHPRAGTYPLRQIDLMSTDGSRRVRITDAPLCDNLFSRFSPDGLLVAHYRRQHEGERVIEGYVVRKRDGSGAVEVLRCDRLDVSLNEVAEPLTRPYWFPVHIPCWSPDGSQIAMCICNLKFHQRRKPRFALVIAAREGPVKQAIDLGKLGIDFVGGIDWR